MTRPLIAASGSEMYAAVADMRAEGVTVAAASDDRLESLLSEATALIDRVTGWFFEPRLGIYRLDGRASVSIELLVPPLRIDHLVVSGAQTSLAFDDFVISRAPIQPGLDSPRITFTHCRRFPRDWGNVVDGLWGFTEPDGTPEGRTSLAIRRA
jgi:hypothetical protein